MADGPDSPARAEARFAGLPRPRGWHLAGWLARRWPYALVFFLYVATSPFHQGLNNPNEMVRVYMTRALVEDGSMVIDRAVRDWGPVDDKAVRDGRLYSSKAPLQSLLGVPAYAAARPLLDALGLPATKRALTTVLRLFAAVIPGLIIAGAFLSWARRRALQLGAPVAAGDGAGLAIALGTMLYPYALTYTGHILAALAAGGAYLAIAQMSRRAPMSPRWRRLALLAGAGAGAAPFAEYPSALMVLPALAAAFWDAKSWRARAELLLLFTAGGAAPFVLGLWAHNEAWGSPLRTGYAFLENRAYVELHGEGFFGVSTPKLEALGGALFSPGTGLFFFSPLLLIGLAALVNRCFTRTPPADPAEEAPEGPGAPLGRSIAIAGLVGFVLEVLFISAHRGWRGGWTVGPRYIIAVAPLLSVWVIEALAIPRMRALVAAFGAVSIVTTGFAAALYPHLSDVYTNPLRTFLWPSYLRGETTYGIGWWLGLQGGAANLVHVIPLVLAALGVAFAGATAAPDEAEELAASSSPPDGASTRARVRLLVGRGLITTLAFGAILGVIALVPEQDPPAAARENARLWGFWEPHTPGRPPIPIPPRPGFQRPPGLLFEARARWREVKAAQVGAGGEVRPCRVEEGRRCRYGDQPWQWLGPEDMEVGGEVLPLLFFHPIAGATVRATVRPPPAATRLILRHGLTDASFQAGARDPVRLRLSQGEKLLHSADAGREPGLHLVDLTLTSTLPVSLELSCEKDGARVFGFELELYR